MHSGSVQVGDGQSTVVPHSARSRGLQCLADPLDDGGILRVHNHKGVTTFSLVKVAGVVLVCSVQVQLSYHNCRCTFGCQDYFFCSMSDSTVSRDRAGSITVPCVRGDPGASAAFLVSVGEELARSLDYETTLQAVAGQAVPFLADICVVDLADADGRLKPVAVAHADPEKLDWMRDVTIKSGMESPANAVRAMRTREPVVVADLSETAVGRLAREERVALDPRAIAAIREVGPHAALSTPLIARGRVLGVLSLLRLRGAPKFEENEVPLIQQLARQCAQAVDNARLYRESTEATRVRDEFLAATSHELRTPLSEIKGFVTTLLRTDVKWDKSTRQDFLREIERDADRLDALILDLLDLSRLASGGRLHFVGSRVSPAVLVSGALDRLRIRLSNSRLDIDSKLGVLPPVYVNAGRIEQVIANLLENATKYAPGSSIHVTGEVVDDGVNEELVIEDDGPGISHEDLERIFDRFYRGSTVERSEMPGSGLGLSVARMIVDAHGGTITADNRPGGGARFVVTLPIAA
jgi:signal transduction histidine kinase